MTEAVSRGFRKHGYAGVGIDKLAKDAGVTSGAFYSHFGSKSGAFDVALNMGLDEVIKGIPTFQTEHGKDWVEAFVDYYLSPSHRLDVECGCAMTTLTPEVTRSDADIRTTFEKKMAIIVGLITQGLDVANAEEGRARAWSMLGNLIGGLNLVRAMNTNAASDEVANAIKVAAINAAGPTRSR